MQHEVKQKYKNLIVKNKNITIKAAVEALSENEDRWGGVRVTIYVVRESRGVPDKAVTHTRESYADWNKVWNNVDSAVASNKNTELV